MARPAHRPDIRTRQLVELLAGFAIPQDRIAPVIGIDKKTLIKHYGDELARGSAVVEAKLVGNLLRLASGRDGTALNAIRFALQCRFGWSKYAPRPTATVELHKGKKEQALEDAETAHLGTDWADLLN